MKTNIRVINLRKPRRFLAATVIIGVVGLLLFFLTSNAKEVFSSEKQLPIYSVERLDKVCAITFDCAWGASDIPDILETLEEAEIKASFFVVGQWAEKFPDAIRLMAQKGHDVANHSYSHLRMGALDKDKIRSEIAQCTQVLDNLTGKKTDLFRAPYGDYNNPVVSTARGLGMYTIQWNLDSLDWRPGISESEILSRITQRIKPGSILLFHNDTPHTARLLPTILTSLKKEGYAFVPVSQLILREGYIIDFEGRQRKNAK